MRAEMTQQEASARISTLIVAAKELITEAEALADAHKLEFSFSVAYGMGGYYYGKGSEETWGEHGWNPSSRSC